MSLQIITFKLSPNLAKKLKAEPKQNRIFNNHSEILRTLTTLYLEDRAVKHFIHEAMKRRYGDIIDAKL